jgi:hypothetical protein
MTEASFDFFYIPTIIMIKKLGLVAFLLQNPFLTQNTLKTL